MKNPKKVTWCENWVKATFAKLKANGANGIERNHFFRLAEKSGLYKPDTYDSEMSQALSNLFEAGIIELGINNDADGNFAYHSFNFVNQKRSGAA